MQDDKNGICIRCKINNRWLDQLYCFKCYQEATKKPEWKPIAPTTRADSDLRIASPGSNSFMRKPGIASKKKKKKKRRKKQY